MNILVFPGGTEIGLEIFRCLAHIKNIKLFSVASKVSNHAKYVYMIHDVIPDIYSTNCIVELNKIIIKNKIDIIYPANDLVIDFLIDNKDKIKSEIILPDIEIVKLTRSKRRTYDYFNNMLPVPELYENYNKVFNYPVFIKPSKGYGSQGAKKIDSKIELKSYLKKIAAPVILEYLPGKEYTVDCFSSRKEGLLFCSGRERARIRMGTSMNGLLVNKELNKIFYEYGTIIHEHLGITGAWFYQMKEDYKGNLKLLEIEPRIAGTMALNRVRGVNFPLLSIYEKLGYKYDIHFNSYEVEIDRALTNRYKTNIKFNAVYIDFDDTIVVNGLINDKIITFLYQCLNKRVKLFLITKSLAKDLFSELKKYRISEIFDDIIWIKESESKADYITNRSSIFIDDSFSQRMEVDKKNGIPTFDSSMIEILFDERI